MVNDPSVFRSHPSKTGWTFWPRSQRSCAEPVMAANPRTMGEQGTGWHDADAP